MNEIRTLLTLELRSFYGINKFRYTRDIKEKSRFRKMSAVLVLLIAMACFYMGSLAYGLCHIGLGKVIPAYLTAISSAFILFFGIFGAGQRIFSRGGYDIIASMPLKTSSVVISRFIGMYISDLVLTAVITVPGFAVYAALDKPNFGFYPTALLGILLIPAIPLVISVLFGTLVMALSSRIKNKSLIQTALSVLLVVGVMLISFGSESAFAGYTEEQFADLATVINISIGKFYPPALWLNNAMSFDFISLLLLLFVSLAVIAAAIFIVCVNFKSIIHRLSNISVKKDYKVREMSSNSLTKALTLREMKRYFSSSIYVTNTIIGPIMGVILSVAVCIVGIQAVQAEFPAFIDVKEFLPFVFAAVFSMMNTTSVSISMEGRYFWIVKSLPVPMKALIDSKILFNLCLLLPFFIISEIALFIAVQPDLSTGIFLVLIPCLVSLFSVIFGMTVNLKFHSFDWEREETIVKQSFSSALGGFSGPVLCIILGVITALIPTRYETDAKFVICALVLLVCRIMYFKCIKKTYTEIE